MFKSTNGNARSYKLLQLWEKDFFKAPVVAYEHLSHAFLPEPNFTIQKDTTLDIIYQKNNEYSFNN